MYDTVRETTFGQILYHASGGRVLNYPEERPGFVVPERYQKGYKSRVFGERSPVQTPNGERYFDAHHDERSISDATRHEKPPGQDDGSQGGEADELSQQKQQQQQQQPEAPERSQSDNTESSAQTLAGGDETPPQDPGHHGKVLEENRQGAEDEEKREVARGEKQAPQQGDADPYLVEWYGDDDPENPLNWSQAKKFWVTFNLCFLTFSVYMASSIVTPSLQAFATEHNIGSVVASLSISLFVLGYAIGPLILSPISEIPAVGRNLPYVVTLAIFVILQVPTAIIHSTAGFMVLRFLAGFIGSPPLATGGATIGDMYIPKYRAIHIGIWGLSAVCGPSLGPLVSSFATFKLGGWRWSIWPVLMATGACLVLLFFSLPETSSANILLRRAKRLRKLTGNENLRSAGEIAQAQMTPKEIALMTLVRPWLLTAVEPMVFFLNLLIGLVYAVLYAWLEAFPLVFEGAYGWNQGELGLAFISLFLGAVITYIGFVIYCKVRLEPLFDRKGGMVDPEDRLEPAFFGIWWLPICLFGFGWTATASIHWIVPLIFAGTFSIGTFLAFQSVLNALADAYPLYVASVLASNDVFRSILGAVMPLVSRQMYNNLQANGPTAFPVAWGSTLLGCISLLFLPLPFVFHRWGPKLRSYSKYAS